MLQYSVRSLRAHIEGKHERVRYPYDQCDHAAYSVRSLRAHIEVKHEGVRYPYDQCDHAACIFSKKP